MAGEVNVSTTSYHLRDNGQNDLNLGVGYISDTSVLDRFGLAVARDAAGVYWNSRKTWSIYVGSYYPFYKQNLIELGAIGGIVSGYKSKTAGIIPFAAMVASIEIPQHPDWSLRFTAAPMDGGVITMSIGYRFDIH
jgi:hypothetical protein